MTGGVRDVVEIPREHGKTTLRSFATPIWLALTGRKRHVVIVGESLAQACEHLSNIKDELNENLWVRVGFGDYGERTAKRWSSEMIVLGNGVVIRAMGKGQSVRGMIRRGNRPDLIIIDDPQKLGGVKNHEQREKDWQWVLAEILPALDKKKGDLLINGTRLHRFCITAHAAAMAAMVEVNDAGETRKANAWTATRYEAIEDGKPLWPGRYSLDDLHRIKADVGTSAWAREYRNAPHEDGAAAFNEEWLRYEEVPHDVSLERAVFMDAAGGNETGDYTAVVEAVKVTEDGHPLKGVVFATRAWVTRETPRMGARRLASAARANNGFPIARAGVENDTYGELGRLVRDAVKDLAKDGGPTVPVRTVDHRTNKVERIMRLQAPAETGMLRFAPELKGSLLVEQLLDIPMGSHDDGPDALEGAWHLLTSTGPGIYVP